MEAKDLREQFEKETGHPYSYYSGHENYYTHWLEQKLLSTHSQEKMAVGYSEDEILKACEYGELSNIDIAHLISCLKEIRLTSTGQQSENKTGQK